MAQSDSPVTSQVETTTATWTEVASFPAGSGDLEVGYDLEALGGGPRGPESLSRLPDAGICVLDSVNRRIHVLGSGGQSTIGLPFESYPVDVVATDAGMHVLHDANEVTEISYKGAAVGTSSLPSGMAANDVMRLSSTSAGSIELWAGNYHMVPLGSESPQAETDRLERTEPLDEAAESAKPAPVLAWTPGATRLEREGRGVLGPDGRYWMSELTDEETGQIGTSDGAVTIPIVVKATFGSARIVGFDKSGEIYVLVEDVLAAPTGTVVELTVQRYHPGGELTGVARLPLEDFVTHPRCPVEVQADGSVDVMVPRAAGTTVYSVRLGTAFEDYESLVRSELQPVGPEAENREAPSKEDVGTLGEASSEAGVQAVEFEIKSRLDTFRRAKRMAAPDGDMWAWYPCNEWVPNGDPRPSDAQRPNQFAGFPTEWDGAWRYFRGIPYTWGGFDSPWSHTDWAPWTHWGTAVGFYGSGTFRSTRGPLVGKANTGCTQGRYLPCAGSTSTGAYYRYIAGIDCSGFVAAAAGYIPRENAKPGTDELATTAGFDHGSALDAGNTVLNVQPMNYFVGPGHVLYYVGRNAATGGLLTLEATTDDNPQGAKSFTRLWSWVNSVVPNHRGWWPKGPGDSPYFGFTSGGAGQGQYAMPRQSVWYKITASGPTRVQLKNIRGGNANLFIYRPYAAPNGSTQYTLYASSMHAGTAEEAADILEAGTFYARVLIESVSNPPYPAKWDISWNPSGAAVPLKVGAMWLSADRPTAGGATFSVELMYQDATETFEGLRTRFKQLRSKGVDIWIRIDKAHGQTLPGDENGRTSFAQFCRRVAVDPDYRHAKGLIIGNEPNLRAEGGILPKWVMTVVSGFNTRIEDKNNVFEQVRAANSSMRVLIPAVGPWNAETPGQLDSYPPPPDGRSGLMAWEQYQSTLAWCAYHSSSHWSRDDAQFAMHTYSNVKWASDPANEPKMDIRNPAWMNAQYGIRVYDDLMYQIRMQAGGSTAPNLVAEWNSYVEESWPADNYPAGLMVNAVAYIASKPNVLGFAVFIDDHRMSSVWERTAVSAHNSTNLTQAQRDRLRAWDTDFGAAVARGSPRSSATASTAGADVLAT